MAHGDETCTACALERELLAGSIKAKLLGLPCSTVRLGAFELERCLGRGSAGIVFAATDTRTGAEIALKHFHAQMVPAHVKREFRVLSHLLHPNLVRLHELFSDQGRWFFTMELVPGESFSAHVRDGRPAGTASDGARLRDAFIQLLRGVAAIHAAGHVHRDLKPANALVAPDGRVVVLDYGLVRTFASDASHASGIVGTPGYIAPEQRHDDMPSPTSDMYSLGVMLFEALTGCMPALAVQARPPTESPRPSAFAQHVPQDLDALCTRLLSTDPLLRPSAEIALAEMEHCSTAPATRSEPPAATTPELFVGRGAQLEALRARWHEARAGHARIVLVEGESGIGKSALLRRFCGELSAAGDVLVLEGRCYQREHVRFNLFDDLIQGLAGHLQRLPERERLLRLPRHLSALATLFPALSELATHYDATRTQHVRPESERSDSMEERSTDLRLRAFAALHELLSRVRDAQPIVISVDDLQWSDHDSLRLLRYLFATPHAPAVLVVASVRRGTREHDPLFPDIIGERLAPALERLQLEALSAEEVDELLSSLHRCPLQAQLRDQIVRESKCIPFLVRELAEYHATAGGSCERQTELAAMLRERSERRSAPAQRVLEVLSVAQRPLPLEVALEAAGLPHSAADAGVELCDAKLASSTRPLGVEHLEIYHDRLRETLQANLDGEHIRSIHERVADALAVSSSGDAEDQVQHRLLAGQPERGARLAALAAERAAHHLRWNRAATLLEMALQWSGADPVLRRQWLERLGGALSSAGEFSEAADAYARLLAMRAPDPDGRVTRMACQQLLRAGRLGEGIALIKQLYQQLGLYFPESETNPLLMYFRARATVRVNLARRWKAQRAPLDHALLHKLEALEAVMVELTSLDPIRGRIVHGQFLQLAFASGDRERILHALLLEISQVCFLHGKRARKRMAKLLPMVAALATESDTPYARALQWLAEGVAAFACREAPGQALAAFRRADELLSNERPTTHFMREMLAEYRSIVAELTGDFQDLTSIAATRLPDQAASRYSVPVLMQGVPLSLLVNDRPEDAARFLDGASGTDEVLLLHYFRVIRGADVAFYAGDLARAEHLIEALRARLKSSLLLRSPLFRQSFAFYRARCAAARFFTSREPRDRLEVERCERAAHEPNAARYNRGFIRLLCAGVAVADGRRRDARRWLDEAMLDFSLSEAQNGAFCAKYRLAQLDDAHDELRRTSAWFKERGVIDPEKWVSVWAPMPKASAA